jgi:hypothetical protein
MTKFVLKWNAISNMVMRLPRVGEPVFIKLSQKNIITIIIFCWICVYAKSRLLAYNFIGWMDIPDPQGSTD